MKLNTNESTDQSHVEALTLPDHASAEHTVSGAAGALAVVSLVEAVVVLLDNPRVIGVVAAGCALAFVVAVAAIVREKRDVNQARLLAFGAALVVLVASVVSMIGTNVSMLVLVVAALGLASAVASSILLLRRRSPFA